MNLSIYIHTECGRNFPSHSPVSATGGWTLLVV